MYFRNLAILFIDLGLLVGKHAVQCPYILVTHITKHKDFILFANVV